MAWARLHGRLIAEPAARAIAGQFRHVADVVHDHMVPTPEGLWLHGKGAAEADRGLAPLAGSRDDQSFLLAADPGPEALWSLSQSAGRHYACSSMHGRIRKVRSEPQTLNRKRFGGQFICKDRDLLIEEAGHAYKPAAQVLADLGAFGLARRLAEVTPVLTYKTARVA